MKILKKKLYFFIFIFFLSNLFSLYSVSEINNKIIVKVGDEIITSLDLQNEIITNLIINKENVNQENIDKFKDFSIKNLINKKIKLIEINKFKIDDYDKNELKSYLVNIASNKFDTNIDGLKNIFEQNLISYENFVKNFEVELLWKTLIFQLYKNQTNINMFEVENEISKIKNDKSEQEIKEIKSQLINQKKQEKLNLFSRSHFSNLENSIQIIFL